MDRTVRVGVVVLGGLAAVALVVLALVLALDLSIWAGLALLGVSNVALLVWAYVTLKIRQSSA